MRNSTPIHGAFFFINLYLWNKLAKEKVLIFFHSYFDVYNELNNEDKVAFIDALLDRQFMGIKPTNLKEWQSLHT
jgi:hypothetical protein